MSQLQLKNEVDIHAQSTETFKIIAYEVASMLTASGINVKPYKPETPFFSKLGFEQKQGVLKHLKFYRDLCAEQIEEGYQLKDSHSFTWRALMKLGLTPTSDLFELMKEEDIVEVYSAEGIQLYRNFKFFEFCSYSLEEIYCLEWWNLYERDATVLPSILEDLKKIHDGTCPNGIEPAIGWHHVREAQSEEKLSMEYRLRWLAPLHSRKQFAGSISLEEARLYEN